MFFKFDGCEKPIYIDDKLAMQFDEKVVKVLKKKDMDRMFVVTGEEGAGKSVATMGWGAYISTKLGSKFNVSNICFTAEEFKKKIENCGKNEVVILDVR